VAKKARKRLEEEAEANSFEFPVFDERAFISHEFEQTVATGFAVAFAVLLAVISFGLDRVLRSASQAALEGAVPALVSLALIIASPFLLRRLRTAASTYTRGDWASLILLELFGWLGFWFLLTDVFFRT